MDDLTRDLNMFFFRGVSRRPPIGHTITPLVRDCNHKDSGTELTHSEQVCVGDSSSKTRHFKHGGLRLRAPPARPIQVVAPFALDEVGLSVLERGVCRMSGQCRIGLPALTRDLRWRHLMHVPVIRRSAVSFRSPSVLKDVFGRCRFPMVRYAPFTRPWGSLIMCSPETLL